MAKGSPEIPEKVQSFENFLNETLREDLKNVIEERDRLYGEISEYLLLKTTVETIQASQLAEGVKTKVDLGCNFYVQAAVSDPSRIFVAVGYGFYVEFTLEEAIRFADKKIKRLTEMTNKLTKDSSQIKANIKVVLQGLNELQGIDH